MPYYARQSYGSYRQNTRRSFGPQPDATKFDAFKVAQPAIGAWIEAKRATFEFAASLQYAVMKYGDLTPGQYEAVERCMQRDAERASQRAGNAPQSAIVDASRVRAAFDAAVSAGLRTPRVTIAGFQLSLAPAHGRNPGAIYVKQNGEYVGKVVGNQFQMAHNVSLNVEALQAVFADPAAAARLHGVQTGECSCCGRTLTDPVSIAAGIGPICADRYGWSF
jgi:hypothetical protein